MAFCKAEERNWYPFPLTSWGESGSNSLIVINLFLGSTRECNGEFQKVLEHHEYKC